MGQVSACNNKCLLQIVSKKKRSLFQNLMMNKFPVPSKSRTSSMCSTDMSDLETATTVEEQTLNTPRVNFSKIDSSYMIASSFKTSSMSLTTQKSDFNPSSFKKINCSFNSEPAINKLNTQIKKQSAFKDLSMSTKFEDEEIVCDNLKRSCTDFDVECKSTSSVKSASTKTNRKPLTLYVEGNKSNQVLNCIV